MTDRLYYKDSYLKAFEARIISCRPAGDGSGFFITLDRSAFYPTSGGQPHDTGRIGPALVLDVFADGENEVIHRTDIPLAKGSAVSCEIDWTRRFDHMQQHGGEHILAGSLQTLFGGYTHGLHIGADVSTIDVTMPDGGMSLSEAELARLGILANSRVQTAAPIRAWFPDGDEMASLPLRKEPTVSEHVRVVMAGDFECVACGGTHPKNTGEIGLILPLSAAPARGKLRLSFLCGMRALRYTQTMMISARQAGAALSAPMEGIGQAAGLLRAEQSALRAQNAALKKENAAFKTGALLSSADLLPDGTRLITSLIPDADALKDIASSLAEEDGIIALLAAPDEQNRERLVFARSANLAHDMAALMRACGAKGGGRPDFAQGIARENNSIERAKELLISPASAERLR